MNGKTISEIYIGKKTIAGTEDLDRENIEIIIKKLKNRTSLGIDEISNEMMKCGGEALLEEIHKFLNNILDARMIPAEWKGSITIPVFKNISCTDLSAGRVTLLNSVWSNNKVNIPCGKATLPALKSVHEMLVLPHTYR